MSRPAILVESISKRFQLGAAEKDRYSTFQDAMVSAVTAPLRNLQRLRGNVPDTETHWALRDISFEVARGEVTGIIGVNGAGKSTLLKILSRIMQPTAGTVRSRGRIASLLEVGTGFHGELTGRENTFLNGAILGMKRQEVHRKLDEIVAFAGVEKFIDTPVKRYSSGMYLRLAFAVAAHLEPEILIVDEVLAVGDMDFQRRCMRRMHEVSQGGRTVLLVSHNMAAIESLCKNCVLLDAGRLAQVGPVEEVAREYRRRVRGPQGAAVVDLEAIQDPRRKIRAFRSATLIDGSGQPTGCVPVGGDFELRIRVDASQMTRSASGC
jgi:lipopolysaccharide transport system ATP-binding protein